MSPKQNESGYIAKFKKNITQNSKTAKGDASPKKKKENNKNPNTPKTNTVSPQIQKQKRIERLQKKLDEKYRLEQQMARIIGGGTGVVELREYVLKLWNLNDWKQAETYEKRFCNKFEQFKKFYNQYQTLKTKMGKEYKRYTEQVSRPNSQEKELYRLLLLCNNNEMFFKEILEEYSQFEKNIRSRKENEESGEEKHD